MFRDLPPVYSPIGWGFLTALWFDYSALSTSFGSFPSSSSSSSPSVSLSEVFCASDMLLPLWNSSINASHHFWESILAPLKSDLLFSSAFKDETTLNGVFLQSLNLTVSAANRQLGIFPFFSYKADKEWEVSALADGVGVYRSEDGANSLFLICRYKRCTSDEKYAIRQIGKACSDFAMAGQRAHFLSLFLTFSGQSVHYSVYLNISLKETSDYDSEGPPEFLRFEVASDVATQGNDKLSRLMTALAWSGLQSPLPHQVDLDISSTIATQPGGKLPIPIYCARFEDHWVKIYPQHLDRCIDVNLSQIPGAELVVDVPHLKIMRYPHLRGGTCPSPIKLGLLLKAAEKLLDLHIETKHAHGDVRGMNLIFDPDAHTVHWIDFDYSSDSAFPRCYPDTWLTSLPDALRHPDACPERPVLMEHDSYSFLSLLALYKPINPKIRGWFTRKSLDKYIPKTKKQVNLSEIIAQMKKFPSDLNMIFFTNYWN